MPTPQEQAAEGSAAGGQGLAEASADPVQEAPGQPSAGTTAPPSAGTTAPPSAGTTAPEAGSPSDTAASTAADTVTGEAVHDEDLPGEAPAAAGPPGPSRGETEASPRPERNRAATTSLVAGILGATGLGALLGLGFGAVGLARARTIRTGKVRCWTGIVLSLLWVGTIVYVTPHAVKAADPGCTAFKEKVLPYYNKGIEDLDSRVSATRTTADLQATVAGLSAATAKSKNAAARAALRALTAQLKTASADQISGEIPSSVMRTLNHDAVVADNACGTI
jgi:hypothetical protein